MAEQKLSAAATDAALQNVFNNAPGSNDRPAFIGVFDIGQGNFNAIFNQHGQPILYFDLGGGVSAHLFTYPDPAPVFCYSTVRMIVQSDFDKDHFKTGALATFLQGIGGMNPLPSVVIPSTTMGNFAGAVKDQLLLQNVDVYFWPVARPRLGIADLDTVTLPNVGIEIIHLLGGIQNNWGLALRIRDTQGGHLNDTVLLPADANFRNDYFPWNIGGFNPDTRLVGITASHHGARVFANHVPRPLAGPQAIVYSYGPGNGYGHPFSGGAPDGVQSYQGRGWIDAGRMQTAGRPGDQPHWGPRGNIGILLTLGRDAVSRPAADPNAAPGQAAVANAAVALVAAAVASRVHAEPAASPRVAVAAAYQAALEHHRSRADHPVADFMRERGAAAAPIRDTAGGPVLAPIALHADLQAAINGNSAPDVVDVAVAVAPLARGVAQLVAEASIVASSDATQAALTGHANAAALVQGTKRQTNQARQGVIAEAANGSAARTNGAAAAKLVTGPARGLRVRDPRGFAITGGGAVIAADRGNSRVVSLNFGNGALTLVAGAARTPGGADADGYDARFREPEALVLNGTNILVADTGNHAIRKIDTNNNNDVSSIAGAFNTSGTTDANGANARFHSPRGLAYDATASILYVADTENHTIRAITATADVTTLAGTATQSGVLDGVGAAARFNLPTGIAQDAGGFLFVSDAGSHTIRRIVPKLFVETLAGTAQTAGHNDATGVAATFNAPSAICSDGGTGYFVADAGSHIIRHVTAAGLVTTIAGAPGFPAHTDGVGGNARFNTPRALHFDGTHLWVADSGNHVIRSIDVGANVATEAGTAGTAGNTDAQGTNAVFHTPSGLAPSGAGLFVADAGSHVIRHIDVAGNVTTVLGTVNGPGSTDAQGTNATFNAPAGLAVDNGLLWVADTGNNLVRVVDLVLLNVVTIGGTNFSAPYGVTALPNHHIAVMDGGNNRIWTIDPAGPAVSAFAGGGAAATTDGRIANARFATPAAACVDGANNLVVADAGHHTLRVITTGSALVTTVAGTATTAGSNDAVGLAATFRAPAGLAFSGAGVLTIADSGNHVIRAMAADGTVTTFAGTAGTAGAADGLVAVATFDQPRAVVVSGADLYVADSGNDTIRRISAGSVSTLADVVVATALAENLLGFGHAAAAAAEPTALEIDTAADALCARAAQAYCAAIAAGFGRPATENNGVLLPGQSVPRSAATAHAAITAVAVPRVEPDVFAAIAAAGALGPAVEVQTTGVALPGAAAVAAEYERRLMIAAVAAMVGLRHGTGTGAQNAAAAAGAARTASAAARGGPIIGCHRHPRTCGAATCSLSIYEFQ